jgi:hypothetical protein
MRLPRMTTRRWMIVIAIVGLALGLVIGGFRLQRRQSEFLARAQRHAKMEALYWQQEANVRAFFEAQTAFIRALEKMPGDGFLDESALKKAKAKEADPP